MSDTEAKTFTVHDLFVWHLRNVDYNNSNNLNIVKASANFVVNNNRGFSACDIQGTNVILTGNMNSCNELKDILGFGSIHSAGQRSSLTFNLLDIHNHPDSNFTYSLPDSVNF